MILLHFVVIAGKSFSKKETFGQFPLQVDGVSDLHESLEAATAQGEIETLNQDSMTKSGQEVGIYTTYLIILLCPPVLAGRRLLLSIKMYKHA